MRVSFLLLTACGRIGFDEVTPVQPLCEVHSTALYCNDFDDDDLKGAFVGGGTFVLGGALGTPGYKFTAAPGDMPRLSVDLGRRITTGPVFLSARFLIAEGAPIADFVVLGQLLSNAFTGKVSVDLVTDDRAQIVNSNAVTSLQGEPGSLPRDRWTCFELSVVADRTGNGSLALALDDQLLLGGPTSDPTVDVDGFGKAELGAFASTSNGAAIDITFDDWVVDTSPVGCR